MAAFRSRSWTAPQPLQVHARMLSGLGASLTPQAEHAWLVGSNRPILAKGAPVALRGQEIPDFGHDSELILAVAG